MSAIFDCKFESRDRAHVTFLIPAKTIKGATTGNPDDDTLQVIISLSSPFLRDTRCRTNGNVCHSTLGKHKSEKNVPPPTSIVSKNVPPSFKWFWKLYPLPLKPTPLPPGGRNKRSVSNTKSCSWRKHDKFISLKIWTFINFSVNYSFCLFLSIFSICLLACPVPIVALLNTFFERDLEPSIFSAVFRSRDRRSRQSLIEGNSILLSCVKIWLSSWFLTSSNTSLSLHMFQRTTLKLTETTKLNNVNFEFSTA